MEIYDHQWQSQEIYSINKFGYVFFIFSFDWNRLNCKKKSNENENIFQKIIWNISSLMIESLPTEFISMHQKSMNNFISVSNFKFHSISAWNPFENWIFCSMRCWDEVDGYSMTPIKLSAFKTIYQQLKQKPTPFECELSKCQMCRQIKTKAEQISKHILKTWDLNEKLQPHFTDKRFV